MRIYEKKEDFASILQNPLKYELLKVKLFIHQFMLKTLNINSF